MYKCATPLRPGNAQMQVSKKKETIGFSLPVKAYFCAHLKNCYAISTFRGTSDDTTGRA
jgi:hypothetical protein